MGVQNKFTMANVGIGQPALSHLQKLQGLVSLLAYVLLPVEKAVLPGYARALTTKKRVSTIYIVAG